MSQNLVIEVVKNNEPVVSLYHRNDAWTDSMIDYTTKIIDNIQEYNGDFNLEDICKLLITQEKDGMSRADLRATGFKVQASNLGGLIEVNPNEIRFNRETEASSFVQINLDKGTVNLQKAFGTHPGEIFYEELVESAIESMSNSGSEFFKQDFTYSSLAEIKISEFKQIINPELFKNDSVTQDGIYLLLIN